MHCNLCDGKVLSVAAAVPLRGLICRVSCGLIHQSPDECLYEKAERKSVNTVGSVAELLNQLAPLSLSEDWDNTGLLVGAVDQEVSKLMTCLTVTEDVVSEAVGEGADMIVSHHPMLFRAAKRITTATAEGRMLLKLILNGVSVYSPHTAFDSCDIGINQRLAESLKLLEIQSLRPSKTEGVPGSGRCGVLREKVPLSGFLQIVKNSVAAEYVEFSGNSRSAVAKVAVACGSAAEFLEDAIQQGCDTFVTGEVRFHSALEAQAADVNLIVVGHYESEWPAVEWLAKELGDRIPNLNVFVSKRDKNPLQLFS